MVAFHLGIRSSSNAHRYHRRLRKGKRHERYNKDDCIKHNKRYGIRCKGGYTFSRQWECVVSREKPRGVGDLRIDEGRPMTKAKALIRGILGRASNAGIDFEMISS